MANEFKVKKGLIVDGTNTVLDIQGTQGQLFSVTDSLTGDLFSVSDISGVPILNVNSSGLVTIDGNITQTTGTTATFSGNVQANGGIKVVGPSSHNTIQSGNSYVLGLNDQNGTNQWWFNAYTNGNFAIHENNVGDKFTIAAGGNATFSDQLTISTISAATTDTDKFLVSDSGVLKFRTGAELLSDIGGQASGSYLTASSTQDKYIRSDIGDAASGRISFNGCDTNNHDTIATSTGSLGAIEIYNNGLGNDAFMTFHVGSDFACYFGLDGGTNKLSVGGWSMGANSYEIYHSGNLPSLSTLGAQASGSYAAASHNHSAADITSGTLAVARGGTGVTTSDSFKNFVVHDFTVYGDSDKYYPVIITGIHSARMTKFQVYRQYSEHGPNDWNNSTHKGGLTFDVSFRVGGWGGYPNMYQVDAYGEIYSRIFGGLQWTAHTMKMVIWLRGGGTGGANYHISAPGALGIQVCSLTTDSNYVDNTNNGKWFSYDHPSNNSYDVYVYTRTQTQANTGITSEVYPRMPIRNGASLNTVGTPSYTIPFVKSVEVPVSTPGLSVTSTTSATGTTETIEFKPGTLSTATGNLESNDFFVVYNGNAANTGHKISPSLALASETLSAITARGSSTSTACDFTSTGSQSFGTGGVGDLYVGGTSGNYARFHTNNSDTYLDMTCGDVIWRASSAGGSHRFEHDMTNGKLICSGDVVAFGSPSDKRLKENIKPIDSALDKVMKLNGVTFDWKEKGITNIKEDIGFIAQDVQKVIPELVRENKDGMLSMRHQGVTPILLEAIKELKAEIEELKKQIK